jgi:hypothetical protein
MLCGQLQQTLRETIVVLFLLKRVVESGMTQIFLAIGDEKLFKL